MHSFFNNLSPHTGHDSGGATHDDNAKERVREATDIVDLAGSYITLRRSGKNFVGLCLGTKTLDLASRLIQNDKHSGAGYAM